MATISRNKFQPQFGGVPYGNLSALTYTMVTNAAGAFIESDSAVAIGLGDKVRLGVLPAGFTMYDADVYVSDAFTALVTAKIGFEYVDGVDSVEVPQDDDYFGAAHTLHTAGRYGSTNLTVAPVTLPKDAYLIMTTAGAANAAAGRVDVVVSGVLNGTV